ncbi:MAG TPA: VWA domain-containing protein [Pyrinomonadaceae bacterium]|nr:VWA domain-containing protein [Pyrinomonadaceae bacterium]
MADKRSAPRAPRAPAMSEDVAGAPDASPGASVCRVAPAGRARMLVLVAGDVGMPHRKVELKSRRPSGSRHAAVRLFLSLGIVAAFAFLSVAGSMMTTHAQQPQQQGADDARPRRVTNTQQQQPTPTPQQTRPTPTPAPQLQTPPPPYAPTPAPPAGSAPTLQDPGQDVDENDVVKVDTSLVNLNVRVIDRANRPVNDVRQEEFKVFEDGVPQQIFSFTRAEVPISYGLVVDNSGSMKTQLEKVIDATRIIIEQNKPGDETFLQRFISSDEISILQDFTASKEDLLDAMDKMYTAGGQTAVLDAVYLAAEHVGKHKKGDALNDKRRRALILVTDGEDRSSFYKQAELFEFLRENDVQIYIIGFVNELDAQGGIIRKSPKDKAVNLINKLATETGGRAFFPTSLSELPSIAQEITKDLRTQYVVSYSPTNKRRDGTFRKVNVRIEDSGRRDKRIAITRPGYTAPRGGGGDSTTPPSRTSSTSNKQP